MNDAHDLDHVLKAAADLAAEGKPAEAQALLVEAARVMREKGGADAAR